MDIRDLLMMVEHIGVCGALFVLVLAYFRFVSANINARFETLEALLRDHLMQQPKR